MKPILVIYATREGHTQRIAAYLASQIRARGISADDVNAAHLPAGFRLDDYSTAILAASAHRGLHEREIIDFVKHHLAELEHMETAFLSVSLAQAGVEDSAALPERRTQAANEVEGMIAAFVSQTGWHPARIKAVAGALLYSKYNFFVRFVMKKIAQRAGAATDTSKDHVYTDWNALDQLVDELLAASADRVRGLNGLSAKSS